MPLLQTSTLSNQNISSALLVGTYTATRELSSVMAVVFADQVAGGGNYTVYATRQLAGAGSAYEYQGRATQLVASGVTAIVFQAMQFPINNTDVIKVYIIGLAGDTTTPDITCEFWDLGYLRPIVAGRTLAVNADGSIPGEAGSGSLSWPITVLVNSAPVDGCQVWITTDISGSNIIASGYTNASGVVTFMLDLGSYYAWRQLARYSFTNPEAFTVV